MTGGRDLFGQIDALFEKRALDVLIDKGLEHEDFPVLTEVVADKEEQNAQEHATERRAGNRRDLDRRDQDRRLGDRRQIGLSVPLSPRPPAASEDFEHLVAAVEQRLSDLFIRQQLRMEEAVRKAIREELEKPGRLG
ncbi:MAG: hypothetical protein KKG92_01770 [Gammaproteobacteria bacterium]|nr:hypothetical protein [Gammaproteobacteria bacterium]